MRDLIPRLLTETARQPVALARVVGSSGSTPRHVGASMAVTADGEVIGSLAGGCVEGAVFETARDVLGRSTSMLERFGVTPDDGVTIGLPCGGEIEVFVEYLDASRHRELLRLHELIAAGRPVALTTTLTDRPRWHVTTPQQPAWAGVDSDVADLMRSGRHGIVGPPDGAGPTLTEQTRPRCFVQSFVPRARVIVAGSGDHARALTVLARTTGHRVTVVDARAVFTTAERFPSADEVVVDWPHRYLDAALAAGDITTGTVVCAMTHDDKFDVPLLSSALNAEPIGFVGALGSRPVHRRRLSALRAAGVPEHRLALLHSPVGLDLGGHTPEEVAVAVIAEVIAARNSGTGASLSRLEGPIHH